MLSGDMWKFKLKIYSNPSIFLNAARINLLNWMKNKTKKNTFFGVHETYWHLIKGTGFNSFVSPFDYEILGLIMIDAFASCTLIIYFFGKLNASRLINTRSFFIYVCLGGLWFGIDTGRIFNDKSGFNYSSVVLRIKLGLSSCSFGKLNSMIELQLDFGFRFRFWIIRIYFGTSEGINFALKYC